MLYDPSGYAEECGVKVKLGEWVASGDDLLASLATFLVPGTCLEFDAFASTMRRAGVSFAETAEGVLAAFERVGLVVLFASEDRGYIMRQPTSLTMCLQEAVVSEPTVDA